MVDTEIKTMVTYDSNEVETALRCTMDTLEELADLSSKAEDDYAEEIELLAEAARTVDETLREEIFQEIE